MLTQVMDALFQSVSIEKGIEKTIDLLGKTYQPDYIGLMRYVEEIADYDLEYQWFSRKSRLESFSVKRFLTFWKEQYHFEGADVFVERDFSSLSMEERAFYASYNICGAAEFELKTQGDTIGYLVMYWDEDGIMPDPSDDEQIHLVAQMLGEAAFREFLEEQMDDADSIGDAILNRMAGTAVYVVNDEYRLIYMNEALKRHCPGAKLGKVCYECMMMSHEPCKDCIMTHLDAGEAQGRIIYNPVDDKQLHMYMTKTEFFDEPAYIVSCHDYLGDQGDDENARTIYRLATALQYTYHCVLEVNLTRKTYVDITKGERFGIRDRNYIMDFSVRHPEMVLKEDREMFMHFFEEENIKRMFLRGDKDVSIEFRAHTGDYNYKWYRVTILFMDTLPDRDFICFFCYRDIDEQKKQELVKEKELNTALVTAKTASEAQSNFLANISHEIRTPMNGIMGMTSLAREMAGDEGRVLDCLHNIDVSSKHLMSVINDILDVTQLEDGRMELKRECFELEDMLDNIDIMNRQEIDSKCMRFVLDKQFQENHFIADKYRLQQVLSNLLSNAMKYTAKGGEITLTVKQLTRDEKNAIMFFSVRDNGIGISARNKERIFDLHDQAAQSHRGTGMGLAICSNIVEMMHGELKVESKEGEGSEFYFTIPMEVDDSWKRKTEDAPFDIRNYQVEGRRALVVEDNDINAAMMKSLLTRAGYEVDLADDGKEGVIYYVSHSAGYYDLILMDIQMPVMDGYEAAKCIRMSGKDDAERIPVIALTANTIQDYQEKAKEAGMDAFIMKPIDFKDFFETVSGLLCSRS